LSDLLGEPFWVFVLPLPLDLSKHTLGPRGEETRIAPDQDELIVVIGVIVIGVKSLSLTVSILKNKFSSFSYMNIKNKDLTP